MHGKQVIEDRVSHLEDERVELVSLVQRGRTLVSELCEENNALERSLTVHTSVSAIHPSFQHSLHTLPRYNEGLPNVNMHKSTSKLQ